MGTRHSRAQTNTPHPGGCSFGYTTANTKAVLRTAIAPHTFRILETHFRTIAHETLGPAYTLSCVFADEATSAQLNRTYRSKEYTPNVLSFPLSDTAGEIYITPTIACNEASEYGHTPFAHIQFLFIHGCLHLLGLDHGEAMDAKEQEYMQRFTLHP